MDEKRDTTNARRAVLRTVSALVVCALVAAVVEVGVFNLDWLTALSSGEAIVVSPLDGNFNQSLGSSNDPLASPSTSDSSSESATSESSESSDLPNAQFDALLDRAENARSNEPQSLTLNDVNVQIACLRIEFTDSEWHDVTVNVMDESKSSFREVGTIHSSGEPLYLHTEGNVLAIRLDVDGSPVREVSSITLNGVAPLGFSAARWGLIALLLFAFWLFRPAAPWWKQRALDQRAVFPACACAMCAIALVTQVAVCCTMVLDSTDLHGLYQYTDLARALISGQVSLDIEPSEGLLALSNPYDDALRDNIDYYWDYAFYDGRYYTYFGVIPCLVFYVPFYLATGSALPNAVVTAIGVFAFYAGGIYLVRRLIGRWFPNASVASVALCAVAILFGTMSLSLVSLPTIYPVPIACGAACAVWALALWMRACEGGRDRKKGADRGDKGDNSSQGGESDNDGGTGSCDNSGVTSAHAGTGAGAGVGADSGAGAGAFSWGFALAGSFLGALTLGCRPQFFFVFFLILPLFIKAVRDGRVKAWSFFPFIAPIVVVGILLGAYNAARFGSPFDFGSSYNLTNDDMSKHSMSLYVGALGIFGFLLQPPQIIADWPFVTGVNLSYAQNSDLVIEETFGGLFAVAPLILLAFWFLWHKRLRRGRGLADHRLLVALSIVGVVCAFLLAFADACAGGLILRYQVDMGLFVAVAACIGILSVAERPAYSVKLALSALACLSIALSALYFLA